MTGSPYDTQIGAACNRPGVQRLFLGNKLPILTEKVKTKFGGNISWLGSRCDRFLREFASACLSEIFHYKTSVDITVLFHSYVFNEQVFLKYWSVKYHFA